MKKDQLYTESINGYNKELEKWKVKLRIAESTMKYDQLIFGDDSQAPCTLKISPFSVNLQRMTLSIRLNKVTNQHVLNLSCFLLHIYNRVNHGRR